MRPVKRRFLNVPASSCLGVKDAGRLAVPHPARNVRSVQVADDGEEGSEEEDGHGELPGHEFTDCGTQAELSAATITLAAAATRASRRCKSAEIACGPIHYERYRQVNARRNLASPT